MLNLKLRMEKCFFRGKIVGWITKTMEKKKAYVSPRNRMGITPSGKGHYFEMFHGFGIGKFLLEFLKENKIDEVHLRIGKRETLISDLNDWEKHGIEYQRLPYEKQIILPEKYMRKIVIPLSQIVL